MGKGLLPSQQLEYLVNIINKGFNKMHINKHYIKRSKTPIVKYVGFGSNCPSIGWIFPCIKCSARTSQEVQVENTKCSLCFHCQNEIKAYIIRYDIGISADEYCIQKIMTNLKESNEKSLYRKIEEREY